MNKIDLAAMMSILAGTATILPITRELPSKNNILSKPIKIALPTKCNTKAQEDWNKVIAENKKMKERKYE